jgi:hypothetical protein
VLTVRELGEDDGQDGADDGDDADDTGQQAADEGDELAHDVDLRLRDPSPFEEGVCRAFRVPAKGSVGGGGRVL